MIDLLPCEDLVDRAVTPVAQQDKQSYDDDDGQQRCHDIVQYVGERSAGRRVRTRCLGTSIQVQHTFVYNSQPTKLTLIRC